MANAANVLGGCEYFDSWARHRRQVLVLVILVIRSFRKAGEQVPRLLFELGLGDGCDLFLVVLVCSRRRLKLLPRSGSLPDALFEVDQALNTVSLPQFVEGLLLRVFSIIDKGVYHIYVNMFTLINFHF